MYTLEQTINIVEYYKSIHENALYLYQKWDGIDAVESAEGTANYAQQQIGRVRNEVYKLLQQIDITAKQMHVNFEKAKKEKA
jgi:hypothetical protein